MTGQITIVLIEDDPIMGESLVQRLVLEGYRMFWAKNGQEGIAWLRRERPDAVVCDIKLPDLNGEEIFRAALPLLGTTPIIFITAFGEIEQAVRLVRAGADDYLTKPFPIDRLLARLARVRPRAPEAGPRAVLGLSPSMHKVEDTLRRAADIDSPVLLTGETGVGKEMAAEFLHRNSTRAPKPFVAVNCAAIPLELMESQMFGHERGAFTGANARHIGFAERAAEGILFLDEVAELAAAMQAKLLRLIQERRFARLGGEQDLQFRARLISATNADLPQRVAEGRFREDLYYRIHVIDVRIPALRERREEIIPLARHYIAYYADRFERSITGLTELGEEAMLAHGWPGNVRELRNRIERAVALADGPRLSPADLFPEGGLAPDSAARVASLAEARDEAERRHIQATLAQTGGQIGRAAELLQVSRTTLWEKMRRLGLDAGRDGPS